MGINYLKLENFQQFTIKYTVQTSLNKYQIERKI